MQKCLSTAAKQETASGRLLAPQGTAQVTKGPGGEGIGLHPSLGDAAMMPYSPRLGDIVSPRVQQCYTERAVAKPLVAPPSRARRLRSLGSGRLPARSTRPAATGRRRHTGTVARYRALPDADEPRSTAGWLRMALRCLAHWPSLVAVAILVGRRQGVGPGRAVPRTCLWLLPWHRLAGPVGGREPCGEAALTRRAVGALATGEAFALTLELAAAVFGDRSWYPILPALAGVVALAASARSVARHHERTARRWLLLALLLTPAYLLVCWLVETGVSAVVRVGPGCLR